MRFPHVLFFTALMPWLPLVAEPAIDFAREIQPILSDNCYACHGPDETKAEAGLRLDQREKALAGGENGPALVPGDPANSMMMQRIRHQDPEVVMPPPEHRKALSKSDQDLITRWIAQGAPWGTHWAFSTPERPELPEVKDPSWPQNEIDHFVLAKLEEKKLEPSPPASPESLHRRLALDLTGLPPTPAELQKGASFSQLQDQLLSSPHFGEKWAREWLDAARYADSSGYEKDLPREMHFYRDWVVNALNNDLPYSDFIVKQIAGDLLPNPTQDDYIATGYLRNSMTNEEGGAKPEQFRVEGLFDRMDAVGKGILGLTTQCAQCHTHKYDPLTHDEYFGLYAYLNQVEETSYPAFTKKDHKLRATLEKAWNNERQALKKSHPEWQDEFEEWQADLLALPKTEWVDQELTMLGDSGQKYQNLPDGSLINMGYAATKSVVPFSQKTALKEIQGIRVDLLPHPYLPFNGPGRSPKGTAALTEFKFRHAKKLVGLTNARASINPPESTLDQKVYPFSAKGEKDDPRRIGPAAFALDGDQKTAWSTESHWPLVHQPHTIVFDLKAPLVGAKAADLQTELIMKHGGYTSDDNQTFNLGRFRLQHAATLPTAFDVLPSHLRQALETKPAARTSEQSQQLFDHWLAQSSYQKVQDRIEKIQARYPRPTPALIARQVTAPRTTRLFERGEQTKPKHVVEPHVPAFLHPMNEGEKDPKSRLALARWLVSPENHTTARTIVNRIWQSYFGRGLVRTPEDLGLQSPAPSHPGLLDWLAVELMENSWSLKHLHKLITSSATYQQQAVQTSTHREQDPQNEWYARGPRQRLSAELIRDLQLSVSGLLNPEMGGRAVYPEAPAFLFQKPVSYGPKRWPTETDAQRYRRGLYTFRFRTAVHPMLQAFDTPTGEVSCVRRVDSTTPMQALTILNEPMSVEAAIALGARILEADSLKSGLKMAFQHSTSREPNADELTVLEQVHRQSLSNYQKHPQKAETLIESHPPVGRDLSQHQPSDLAAATAVAQVILNLDETISR